ncbi:MAG: hypothetical protein P4L69_06020 [Desulfosporosinus sp.]|nr:hypothetical protein [Desulfosporosinus sp.]
MAEIFGPNADQAQTVRGVMAPEDDMGNFAPMSKWRNTNATVESFGDNLVCKYDPEWEGSSCTFQTSLSYVRKQT